MHDERIFSLDRSHSTSLLAELVQTAAVRPTKAAFEKAILDSLEVLRYQRRLLSSKKITFANCKFHRFSHPLWRVESVKNKIGKKKSRLRVKGGVKSLSQGHVTRDDATLIEPDNLNPKTSKGNPKNKNQEVFH